MKRLVLIIFFLVLTKIPLSAQLTVNGILDSSASMTAGTGDMQKFSFGVEEYANIRFQSRLRDNKAVVYGAVNLIAAAGDYAALTALMLPVPEGKWIKYIDHDDIEQEEYVITNAPAGLPFTAYVYGENYIAGIELERLYFRLNFESANFDGGLFRLPFGYSQIWGSSDFLNPRNPLKPDARPRGILGAAVSLYPKDDIKLIGFTAAPRNPYLNDGSGILAGLSFENHWNKASIQALYSYETPNNNGSKYGIHHAGLSVKADIEAGFVLDALYIYNHEAGTKLDGLSLSAGADYSFFKGKLIVMLEYLYNGKTSSTSLNEKNILGMPDRHYLFSSFTLLINDFTNINFGLISCLDKTSFIPIITFSNELFQGAALTIMAQAPLNRDVFDNGNFVFNCTARLRLRF
ncbi:MAG: hypothetical protein LBU88_10830 [Treponema sp.]|jgi:hypothetical protein|nr:hypothetical protein [Treponema sp.]